MTKKPQNYQDLSEQLDELLAWFDGDQIDVDEAIAKYEQAIQLTKQLEEYLTNAENKLTDLKNTLPQS